MRSCYFVLDLFIFILPVKQHVLTESPKCEVVVLGLFILPVKHSTFSQKVLNVKLLFCFRPIYSTRETRHVLTESPKCKVAILGLFILPVKQHVFTESPKCEVAILF